ncbi:MAG: hypothetical protein ACHQ16_06975 [Candidatus Lutacidiplasmatales archaeon]
MELENALIGNPSVAESAVVGVPDEVKGELPFAVVVLKPGVTPSAELEADLRRRVRDAIGGMAEPESIRFVRQLPKTRSGKIMRRVVAALVRGGEVGDISTLEDDATVEEIRIAASTFREEL